jgi:hypothetical protein
MFADEILPSFPLQLTKLHMRIVIYRDFIQIVFRASRGLGFVHQFAINDFGIGRDEYPV